MERDVSQRSAEIAANLERVEQRVAAACAAAGRARDDVLVVAVTKTFPADDVRRLAALGVTHVGENRTAELEAKAAACPDLDLTWHFVGQLQTNKAAVAAAHAHVVHSIDRARLVTALDKAAARAGRRLTALVQVDLSGQPGRGGAAPADVDALAAAVAATTHLDLGGVMAVAPLGADPARAFATLAGIAARIRAAYPEATVVSAGMSGDLEAAVAAGATHLRVGSALLGSRPPLR